MYIIDKNKKLEKLQKEKEELFQIKVNIFLVNEVISLEQIKFEDGEVINAKYVTLNEFKEMIKNKEVQEYLNYFEDLYNEIY